MNEDVSRPVRRHWALSWVVLGLIAITFYLYHEVVNHEFVEFDDDRYIVDNPFVSSGLNLENLEWALSSPGMSNWHPLTWLSHMIDSEVFGVNPGGPHGVNVALHALNAVLLFGLLRRLGSGLWLAAWIAAVFAWHPLRVESVAWISERKDVLSATFFLLGLHFYVSYAKDRSRSSHLAVSVAFLLGLASKPMVVTFPLVLLGLDRWILGRKWTWETIREKIAWFLLAAFIGLVTIMFQDRAGALRDSTTIPLDDRFLQAFAAYEFYVVKTLWPSNLACFYPHPSLVGDGPSSLAAWRGFILVAGITAISILWRHRHPCLIFGWFWFLVTCLPIIGIVQVGGQAWADRYTYLPGIGIVLALGMTLGRLTNDHRARAPRSIVIGIAIMVLPALGSLTYRLVDTWRNTSTLFERALEVTEKNYLAHNQLGAIALREDRLEEAKEHFESAIDFYPDYVGGLYNLGLAHLRLHDHDRAESRFEDVLTHQQDHAKALNNLGGIAALRGDVDRAIEFLERSLRAWPEYDLPRRTLIKIYRERGEIEKARELEGSR